MDLLIVKNINSFIIAISALFALLLFSEKSISKRVLGFYMTVIVAYYIFRYSFFGEPLNLSPPLVVFLKFFRYSLLVAIAPLLYIYAKSLTTEFFKLNKRYLILFIPSAIIFFSGIFAIFADIVTKSDNELAINYLRIFYHISVSLSFVQAMGYAVAMYFLLKQHANNIKQLFSFNDRHNNLSWLKIFWIIYVIFWILDITNTYILYKYEFGRYFSSVISLLYTTFIGYFGIRQINIYSEAKGLSSNLTENIDKQIQEEEKTIVEDKKQPLSDIKSKEIYSKLVEVIEKEKLYRRSDLSIYYLAEKTNLNRTYLSYAINKEANLHFCYFVNRFRIKEAKEILKNKDYDNLTIEGVANKVGFHSTPIFNNWFKKLTGKTPSQYKKESRFKFTN